MSDELAQALELFFDRVDVWLTASWDEHAQRRVRQQAAEIRDLLARERTARKRAASA